MQSIQPAQLTDRELVQQVYLIGTDTLPSNWVAELFKRLENHVNPPPGEYCPHD